MFRHVCGRRLPLSTLSFERTRRKKKKKNVFSRFLPLQVSQLASSKKGRSSARVSRFVIRSVLFVRRVSREFRRKLFSSFARPTLLRLGQRDIVSRQRRCRTKPPTEFRLCTALSGFVGSAVPIVVAVTNGHATVFRTALLLRCGPTGSGAEFAGNAATNAFARIVRVRSVGEIGPKIVFTAPRFRFSGRKTRFSGRDARRRFRPRPYGFAE